MPNISVIVPVYKVEQYLHRCVSSILAQTYRDFELILVDDGSPDNCGQLCDKYAETDGRVHVIHQKNGGLSAARNAGIDWAAANSGSQWLTFIDSDDWVDSTYLEQLHRAVSETGCAVSACRYYITNGEAAEKEPVYDCRPVSADEFYCSDDSAVATVAVCKLYRKDLFDTVRYPLGKLHEDEFTTYRLLYEAGEIAAVSGELYAYFQNDAGIMRSKWIPRRLDLLEAVEQQIAFAKERELPNLLKKAVKQYIYGVHDQMNQPEAEQYRGQLRKKLRRGLSLGRSCGVFPLNWQNLWAYEEASPGLKPLWWLLYKLRKG